MFGKKQMQLEDFWTVTIGEILEGSHFQIDLFNCIFPEAQYSTNGAEYFLDKNEVPLEHFGGFLRLAALTGTCAFAYIDHPREMTRLNSIFEVGRLSQDLSNDFKAHSLDGKELLRNCVRAFLAQDESSLPPWAIEGSEIFGPKRSLNEEQRNLLHQSNVGFCFLLETCGEHYPQIGVLLERTSTNSRDAFVTFLITVKRLQSFIRNKHKLV